MGDLKNAPNSQSIFIDSDVFVAAVKADDVHHAKVKRLFTALEKKLVTFYTSNYVFAESVTVISQRIGRMVALQFIDSFKSKDSLFATIWITEELEAKGLEVFEKQTSKNVSLIDCTNIAIMREHSFDAIFSFDEIYRKNGLTMIA